MVLRYTAPGTGGGRIALGEVRGRIKPALAAERSLIKQSGCGALAATAWLGP